MQHGFEQAAVVGLGGGELGFELVAQGHQLIDLGYDAVLFGERWETNNKWINLRAGNYWLCSCFLTFFEVCSFEEQNQECLIRTFAWSSRWLIVLV